MICERRNIRNPELTCTAKSRAKEHAPGPAQPDDVGHGPCSAQPKKAWARSGAHSEGGAEGHHGKAGKGGARQEGLHPEVEEQHLQVPRVLLPAAPASSLSYSFFGPGPRPRVPSSFFFHPQRKGAERDSKGTFSKLGRRPFLIHGVGTPIASRAARGHAHCHA